MVQKWNRDPGKEDFPMNVVPCYSKPSTISLKGEFSCSPSQTLTRVCPQVSSGERIREVREVVHSAFVHKSK